MKNGFKAMDSDMHVMEPCDLWQKYIDKKFLDRAPIGLNRHKRDLGVQVDGKIMPRPTPKPIPALRPIRERILNEKYPEEEARDPRHAITAPQAMPVDRLQRAVRLRLGSLSTTPR